MADIFVSYASPDRDRIIPLVQVLEAQGWSVWWDRDLVAGADFDKRIEQALDTAKCVVVAWSENSVESRWCRAEASEGLDRQILVPVRLDNTRPPLAFRNVQTAALIGWPGEPGELDVFLAGVRECLGLGANRTASPISPSRTATRRAWIPFAVAGVLILLLGIWFYGKQSGKEVDPASQDSGSIALANAPRNSLAVLPFENLSPDPDNAYFAAGIHEETLNQLAKVKDFSVIARITAQRYVDDGKSVTEIGQELNVSAVMSGSVRFAEDRVRVTAQLVDVGTGTQRWSEIYDRTLDDIFSIQSNIAENITRAMEVSFDLEAREAIAAIPTENLEAYSAYLKGLAALNQVPPRVPEGVRELDTAIQFDPTFSDALGLSALYRATMSLFQSPTPEAEAENLELAQSLAQRALALNPHQSSALSSLSYIALAKRRWDEQIAYAREAYEIDPNGKLPAYLYAEVLSSNGNADEAIPLFDRAIALNPLNPNLARNAAIGMALNGRWNEARRYASAAIEAGPDAWVFYALAAWVEANTGNLDEATALLKAAEARFPSPRSIPLGLNAGLGRLIATYTLTGQHDAANRELQKLIAQQPDNDAALFFAYWDLGMLDKALDQAHAVVEKGFPTAFISSLAQRWDRPMHKPLHDHPRFVELLDKIGVDHSLR